MMKGGIGQLMKQAKKMQEDMAQAQAELVKLVVVGEAGAGMVKVSMNGKHEVRSVTIDDAIFGDDKDMLEDLLAAAINDAVRRVEATVKDKYSGMAAGMNLPDGFKLPF